ncbi:P1 family peptidase [Nostocoides vanveenii]
MSSFDNMRTGATNSLLDVAGLRVGHSTSIGAGRRTGVTVVVAPRGGCVAGVDVRGAAPGTRETDLLDPRCLVDRVHAVVLSGGSAFGLAAADGVARALYAAGVGWPMGATGEVVPIVPAAVIFDLGRGGDFGAFPGADDGARAYAAATRSPAGDSAQMGTDDATRALESRAGARALGPIGAGTGAKAAGLAGGIGSASAVLPDGSTVAALVVVNAVGSPVDPATGELWAARHGLPGEFPPLERPASGEVAAYREERHTEMTAAGLLPGGATTIGVVATDASLTKAECAKLAAVGHDGIARGIDPAHTLLDGDTLFALATGERAAPGLADLLALHSAAARCVTRAIGHAMLAARTATLWPGTPAERVVRSYLDAFPSARPTAPTPVP